METINYKGYEIKIEQEQDDFSPREWDNIGTMICFHSGYTLGDKHSLSVDEAKEVLKRKDVVALPLFLLDHSGLWMRTGRFLEDSGGWDTSNVGFIYVTREKMKEEFPQEKHWKEKAKKILQGEVETYNQYLSGDVWYYRIEKNGEPLESLGGIYGYEETEKEAKNYIDWHIKEELKNHLLKLKNQIKNKVPLQYRVPLCIQ